MSLDFDPDVVLARISEAQWVDSLVGRALHEAFEVVAELHASVKRVRQLHQQSALVTRPYCAGCGDAWPCMTIRLLDGEP